MPSNFKIYPENTRSNSRLPCCKPTQVSIPSVTFTQCTPSSTNAEDNYLVFPPPRELFYYGSSASDSECSSIQSIQSIKSQTINSFCVPQQGKRREFVYVDSSEFSSSSINMGDSKSIIDEAQNFSDFDSIDFASKNSDSRSIIDLKQIEYVAPGNFKFVYSKSIANSKKVIIFVKPKSNI
jgi:hypothetical protein